MSALAEREAFRKSFAVLSKGLQSPSILYETVPLLTRHSLITSGTAADVISSEMPLTRKVSMVMQELDVQVSTSPTAFNLILHGVLKLNLHHLYVQVDSVYKEELRKEKRKESTDKSALYSYMTDAQQSRKVSHDEPITNHTPHHTISHDDSGIDLSPQVSRLQSIADGTAGDLSSEVIKMKIDDEAQDGNQLPPTPQPLSSRPLLSSPRPNDIPPPPQFSSTLRSLTNPVTNSERSLLARMPMSEQSQKHESDIVMPTQPSVACEDASCLSCVMKQDQIFSLQDENRSLQGVIESLQGEIESDDKRMKEDRCYIQKKLNEIDVLCDRLKSKDEQMKRLKNALSFVERKYKELEEGGYDKTTERQAEKLRKEMEQAKREKAKLEVELGRQYMYIEQMKEHAQKLKNIIFRERQEKEELRKMCATLEEKNGRLEHALSLATAGDTTTTHSSS